LIRIEIDVPQTAEFWVQSNDNCVDDTTVKTSLEII
jgi:hypothetical protein